MGSCPDTKKITDTCSCYRPLTRGHTELPSCVLAVDDQNFFSPSLSFSLLLRFKR